KCVLARKSRWARLRLRALHRLLFVSLLLLPLASRPKARAFDKIGTLDLVRGYARMLDAVFAQTPELGLAAPRMVLWALGVARDDLGTNDVLAASIEAAERAADRSAVSVTALR
ncbi:MAG TPA: ferritin-like domain-containing protein, partial [Polyangiaceae bacterium]|nr:ferritin-like domain-containing protein [Polyangiaceae bacterium]